jgi:hypothetical protein
MKGKKREIFLCVISLLSLMHLYSHNVEDNDIALAVQSIIVASAAVHGLSLLTPPQSSDEASFVKNGSSSDVVLSLNNSDIGRLRNQFLNAPAPVAQPKGFFEMLMMSVTNLFPNYEFIRFYLQNQHLSEEEIILTGELKALRKATSYPFRYEGEGTFEVAGNRVSSSFNIEFSFSIPLEGENRGEIIPIEVLVNGEDALDIASSVFILD